MKLDQLAEAARSNAPAWDRVRSSRVLASTLEARERRVVRARVLRRSFAAASGAIVLVVLLLRGGAAPASTTTDALTADAPPSADRMALAARDGDGGYGRD